MPSKAAQTEVVLDCGATQDALYAAVSRAGPGGSVRVLAADSSARLRMTLAGLVDVSVAPDGTADLVGAVPDHAVGASTSLARPTDKTAWTAVATGGSAFETALVDEDDLLARDDVKDGEGSGCAVDEGGKRKPCKDCSCGLADMDANVIKAPPAEAAAKGGCGSCALGDAFRCAGCPYLGLPPFKPGERVEVPTSLMTSDI
jgi:anamorsin